LLNVTGASADFAATTGGAGGALFLHAATAPTANKIPIAVILTVRFIG
jgi:hypothetical protein